MCYSLQQETSGCSLVLGQCPEEYYQHPSPASLDKGNRGMQVNFVHKHICIDCIYTNTVCAFTSTAKRICIPGQVVWGHSSSRRTFVQPHHNEACQTISSLEPSTPMHSFQRHKINQRLNQINYFSTKTNDKPIQDQFLRKHTMYTNEYR